jgi:hypothetical protein
MASRGAYPTGAGFVVACFLMPDPDRLGLSSAAHGAAGWCPWTWCRTGGAVAGREREPSTAPGPGERRREGSKSSRVKRSLVIAMSYRSACCTFCSTFPLRIVCTHSRKTPQSAATSSTRWTGIESMGFRYPPASVSAPCASSLTLRPRSRRSLIGCGAALVMTSRRAEQEGSRPLLA